MQNTNVNYHKTCAQNFPDAESHVMKYLLRRNNNRNKLQAIKTGLAGSLAAKPGSMTNLVEKKTFLRFLESLTLRFRFESKTIKGFTYVILRL